MASLDPVAINMHQLVVQAMMFRLNQAKPTLPDTITIPRDVFDQLLSVAEGASRASGLPAEPIALEYRSGTWHATVSSPLLGTVRAAGRTVLEVLARVRLEWGYEADRRIS